MKGLELPLSTIVIIILVLIVLLAIVALWMSGFGSGATNISIEAAKSAGCGALMRDVRGCSAVNPNQILFDGTTIGVPKFDVDRNGQFCPAGPDGIIGNADDCIPPDSLQRLCDTYFQTAASQPGCRKVCGCGG